MASVQPQPPNNNVPPSSQEEATAAATGPSATPASELLAAAADPAAMERHRAAVAKIAASVARFFEKKEPYRIFHGSTNSTRPMKHDRAVDISALRNVLHVDPKARRALVEPNVPMDRLVEHTLRHGLVPPVVMEFPGITCGGGFAGTGGESSSFRHGYFDDTVEAVEMVLPDGEVVRASRKPDENPDLFRGAAGAVGTLGVTTALELRLLEAKTYVRTTYRRAGSVAEAVQAIKEEVARPDNDYVDGILYSKDHGVVVSGTMTNEKPADAKIQTFSHARDPWYYLHVQERTRDSSASVVTEYIPLAEYLFRYDRGGFWVGRAAFKYFFMVPFNRVTRWFLDDFLHTRMMYRALHASAESQTFVVQDLALPFETAEQFVDYTAEEFGIWPLWLCPLKRREGPTFHPITTPPSWSSAAPKEDVTTTTAPATTNGAKAAAVTTPKPKPDPIDSEQMLNIGLWGPGPINHAKFIALNRDLEAKVSELGGKKWLYAHTYYDEPEFWSAYGGRAWYDDLRARFRASSLPSVYDKVKVTPIAKGGKGATRNRLKLIWPLGGFYGLYKSIRSRDYWLHRRAEWKWRGEKAEAERRRAVEAANAAAVDGVRGST